MSWRGPDSQHSRLEENGRVYLGHCRLSIVDLSSSASQPMTSQCGRYFIVFTGEIYNHLELRRRFFLNCQTDSDTETLLECFSKIGKKVLDYAEGMFAFVIWDNLSKGWFAARDQMGIKPLFFHKTSSRVLIASEPKTLADIIDASICNNSIEEWKLLRRPLPGYSTFERINELLPGSFMTDESGPIKYWKRTQSDRPYEQDVLEDMLTQSINQHEISDVENVCLLSGGIDSALVTALSKVKQCYTVGLPHNNEFKEAHETANYLQRVLTQVTVTEDELINSWQTLTIMRGEPLSVPNEGLIYLVCKSMSSKQKVVLTGEGADELFFGYDKIYRWATDESWDWQPKIFLRRYGYSPHTEPTERLLDFLADMVRNKTGIDFMEDFFLDVHLPGLLRRMDFASMAASKEARVPFVTPKLINYMYRRPASLKLNALHSKLPLRMISNNLGLTGVLDREKIGFSANIKPISSSKMDYSVFQKVVLGAFNDHRIHNRRF
jgi:asparagine synthase (glutamine-hydrolysing)